MLTINPEQPGSWRLRASVFKVAPNAKEGLSIDPFKIGSTFTSQYVAVGIKVRESKDTWKHGGYLAQKFKFPATAYAQSGKGFCRTEDLLINNVTILKLPLVVESGYSLYYFPLSYFEDVRVQVWEYVGEVIETSSTPPISLDSFDLITESIDAGFANNKADLEKVAANSVEERLQILGQINELDAGIYTLAEGLADLLPPDRGNQIKRDTQNRLNLDLGFL